MAGLRRYFWDFFGPNGEGTARHFHEHLDEFLAREKLAGCATGVIVEDRHSAVYCDAPETHHAVVQRALRPKRFADGP